MKKKTAGQKKAQKKFKKKAFIKLTEQWIDDNFDSLTDCADYFDITRSYLYLCLSGKREMHIKIVAAMRAKRRKIPPYYEYEFDEELPAFLKVQAS